MIFANLSSLCVAVVLLMASQLFTLFSIMTRLTFSSALPVN